ncbi:hypothetical protein NQ317_016034 [Molorchus minor]|uniref:UBA domain-containing protein n=1 Tax=Molorchus minor TaxID=1323400 RepID=A0ABQ9IXG1_9CUCU|nr:hypothetical protein NQ317_016034 [Molorchus minor]
MVDAGELWNCAGSSLHALAVSPRNDISASASPMISPRNSPRCVRRNLPVVVPSSAPPPLPPRKSSPTHEQTILPTTSNNARNGVYNSIGLTEAQSVTNLTHNTIDLPQIPKSSSMLNIELHRNNSSENEVVELSSPRQFMTQRHLTGILVARQKVRLKTVKPVKSNTTPNISQSTADTIKNRINPLERETNVSYENLNMDYIKKLVSEGYSKDSVIKALGITRNNVDMACDILHEFGTKLG